MKNLFSYLYVFVLMIVLVSFGSCSEGEDLMLGPEPIMTSGNYTCTCTLDYVSDVIDDQVVNANYTDVELLDAAEACDVADTAGNNGLDPSIATFSCELTED